MEDTASEVFLLMRRNFRVSRNDRAKWYFQHLDKDICIEDEGQPDTSNEVDHDLRIVSVVANGVSDDKCRKYRMKPDTVVTCLSRRYRLVFVLDVSPSSTTIGRGGTQVLYKNLYTCLERCLKSVAQPLKLPGSQFCHEPEIFVTVIAFSPFINGCSDQVLIQGVPLSLSSLPNCLDLIHSRLSNFINKLSLSVKNWMAFNHAKQRMKRVRRENDSITGNLFQLPSNNSFSPSVSSPVGSSLEDIAFNFDPPCDPAATPPEWTLISLLRLGLVGVQLLPENTQSNIVVITDGEFCEPNAKVLQELLIQLRSLTVSCSFVQIQAAVSRNWGRVAYPALLQFLAEATFGAYVPDCSCSRVDHDAPGLNTYHRHLLCWSFRATQDQHAHLRNANPWNHLQKNITGCLKKRLFVTTYETSLYNLLYIRLREGYTLDQVLLHKCSVQLNLRLPWKTDVRVVYSITSSWPLADSPTCKVQIYAEAYYEFLRDLTIERLKIKSPYRLSCINAFNSTIVSLRESDERLLHLHSFKLSEVYFTLPDSVKNGMPLFYLPPSSVDPVISSNDLQEKHPKFCQFWRPVCTLDINIWQKWLHTHALRFILTPDVPLSPNLHQVAPNSGKYGSVQCRQAVTLVHEALRAYASFTLMEGHSYVKMVWQNSECTGAPEYFFIMRVCMRPPCLVVKVAFLGGRRGGERQHVMMTLRNLILSLKLKQKFPNSGDHSIVPVGVSLIKPIERILVRYSSVPEDLCSIVRLSSPRDNELARAVALHNTLARYFSCRRCIWNLKRPNVTSSHVIVSNEAASYILQAIVRRRLNEGFRFASGSGGIICLIRELTLQNGRKCLIQYLVFPPVSSSSCAAVHNATRKDSLASDGTGNGSERTECDTDAQLVTELWVEPQHGSIDDDGDQALKGCKDYTHIFDKVYNIDRKIVESLTTFEHLNLGCSESIELMVTNARCMGKLCSPPPPAVFRADATRSSDVGSGDSAITIADSVFCIPSLLHCCQQATLVFPALKHVEGGHDSQQLLLDSLHYELSASHDVMFRPSSRDCTALCKLVEQRLNVTPGKSETAWMNGLRELVEDGCNAKKRVSLYCYCKRLSESRMELLALPCSVKDLMLIMGIKQMTSTESSTSVSVSAHATVTEDHATNLIVPVFVFDCYTPRITGLLTTVELSDESLPADWHVYDDFTVSDTESVLANFHKTLQREGDVTSDYDSISVHLNALPVPEVGLFRGRCRSVSITGPTLDLMEMTNSCDPNFSLAGYCGKIESHIFSKAFVSAVHTSLVKDMAIHEDDVNDAIDTKCEEFPLEIDLSEHLPVLCQHVSNFIHNDHQNSDTMEHISIPRCNTYDTDEMSSFTLTSQDVVCDEELPVEFQSVPCHGQHQALLDAFYRLVLKHFCPVPGSPGLFFYKPPIKQKENAEFLTGESGEEFLGDMSSAATDTKDDNDDTVQFIVLLADGLKRAGGSRTRDVSSSSDGSSTLASLCSSSTHGFDSEDGCYAARVTELPVFLQLTCSVRVNDKYVNCPVSQLPTCIVPLLQSTNIIPQDREDMKDLTVYLDLNILAMSPFIAKVDLTQGLTIGSDSGSPLDGDSESSSDDKHWQVNRPTLLPQISLLENRDVSTDVMRQLATISEFPKPEMSAILSLFTGIESLMREESIFRQTRSASKQLNEDQLDQVVSHLAKEATFVQVNPKSNAAELTNHVLPMVTELTLDFVMKQEASVQRLKQLLQHVKVEYVSLSACLPHFYACFVEDLTEFILRTKKYDGLSDAGDVLEVPLGQNPCSEPAHYEPQEIAHPAVTAAQTDSDRCVFMNPITVQADSEEIVSTVVPRSQSFSGIPEQYRLQRARMAAVGAKNIRWKSGTENADFSGSLMDIHRKRLLANGAHGDTSWGPFAVSLSSAPSTDSLSYRPRSRTNEAVGTTEAGYIGEDASMHLADKQRNVCEPRVIVADFWLIVSVCNASVRVYFHEKEQGLHTILFCSCVNIVRKLIERINQEMLLQQMFDTKKVDDLLIAPKLRMNSSKGRFVETTNEYDDDDTPGDGLQPSAAHHFPGTFACCMVWHWWIPIHCRLNNAHRLRVPGGLRDLLGKFGVNRENVYVFKETAPKTGVVYLRLHDSYQTCKQFHTKYLISSYQQQVGESLDKEEKEEKQLAKAFERAILVVMHGVEEPGEELTSELKHLLQSRLDGEILFAMSLALTRHPNLRLTADDVHFVQPDCSSPTVVHQFSFPAMAMTHLYAVSFYLKQHLSSITHMHSPNYMNPTMSSSTNNANVTAVKFKHYGRVNQTQHCEEGTSYVSAFYLYHREIYQRNFKNAKSPHVHCGRCGIACIHVSVVDHNGDFVGLLRSGQIDPQGCDKFFPHPHSCTDQENLIDGFRDLLKTSQVHHKTSPSLLRRRMNRRGPPALLQIAVWERGDVLMDELIAQMHQCLTLALCDVVTEFGLLTAPLMVSYFKSNSSVGNSEPGSPTSSSGEQTVVSALPQSTARQSEPPQPPHTHHHDIRKRHSSAAILPHALRDGETSAKGSNRFSFDVLHDLVKKGGNPESPAAMSTPNKKYSEEPAKTVCFNLPHKKYKAKYLNPVLWGVGSCWLKMASGEGLRLKSPNPPPTARYYSIQLKCPSDIPALIQEISQHRTFGNTRTNQDVQVFCAKIGKISKQLKYQLTNLEEIKLTDWTEPDKKLDIIIIGMSDAHTQQSPHASQDSMSEFPIDRIPQRFRPNICATAIGYLPRKRFFMVNITANKISLQTYNWTAEVYKEFENMLYKDVCWFNAKNLLTRQIALHKMGIMHLGKTATAEQIQENMFVPMYWVEAETLQLLPTPANQMQVPVCNEINETYSKLLCPYYDDNGYANDCIGRTTDTCDVQSKLRSEFIELRRKLRCEMQEEMNLQNLHALWYNLLAQDGLGKSCEVHIDNASLQLLVERSRLEHYVYTPLLFSREWRKKMAQTRQPTASNLPAKITPKPAERKGSVGTPKVAQSKKTSPSRSRHASGSTGHEHTPLSPRTLNRAAQKTLMEHSDTWHLDIQTLLIDAYSKFLHGLGFMDVMVRTELSNSGKHDYSEESDAEMFKQIKVVSEGWLQKTKEGGIILVKLFFSEPYFVLHIYVWDVPSTPPQSMQFYNDWSWFISRSHMHSFSYDFHMRMIASYLTETYPTGANNVHFKPGYDMQAFLNDFLQYYQCRPAFARNCIYEDHLCMEVDVCNLFDYLLSRDKEYGLRVVRMRIPSASADSESDPDYLLVSSEVFVHTSGHKYIALNVIFNDNQPCRSMNPKSAKGKHQQKVKKNVVRLKFYVIFVCVDETAGPVESEDVAGANELDNVACAADSLNTYHSPVSKSAPVGDMIRMDSFHDGLPISYKPTESDVDEESISEGEGGNTSNSGRGSTEATISVGSTSMSITSCSKVVRRRAASGSDLLLDHQHTRGRFAVFKVHETGNDDTRPEFMRSESVGRMIPQLPPPEVPENLSPVNIQRRASAAASLEAMRLKQKLSIQRSAPRRHRKSKHQEEETNVNSLMQRERVTWVAFVSGAQQKLQKALECQVTRFKTKLNRTVSEASWHCRRDKFWERLLSQATSTDSATTSLNSASGLAAKKSKATAAFSPAFIENQLCNELSAMFSPAHSQGLSSTEFDVLLSNVQVVPAEEIDPNVLALFQNMSAASALTLMKTLVTRYAPSKCRFIAGQSGLHPKQYLVISNPNSTFHNFFLVTADKSPSSGCQCKLSLVYKDLEHFNSYVENDENSKSNYLCRKVFVTKFFEDILNTVAYHIWAKTVS